MKYLIFYIYQPKTQLEIHQNVIYQPNTNYHRTLDMKESNKIHQFVGNKRIFRTTEFEHIVWLFMNLNT
jgi:transglutaminase/protease-like cytokinesis protein 3